MQVVSRALTDDGYGIGTPFKSSRIGKDVGYKALQKYYGMSKDNLKKPGALDRLRQTVKDAMSPHNTRDEFRQLLKAESINTVFRINPVGRVYGVTFIDHTNGIVANGWEGSSRPVFSTSCSRPPEKKHCIPQNSTRNANTNNEAARQILSQELSTRCWTWSMRGLSRNSKESSDGGEKGNCIDNN